MKKKDAVDSVILIFSARRTFHGTMTRKIPQNILRKLFTGLQQDKKLAPPLAVVFSMICLLYTSPSPRDA